MTRCTFLDSAGHQLSITNGADQVTVSWCEFTFASAGAANRRSVLIGKAGSETKALQVTMHHNRWHGPVDRDMPLAEHAYLHFYNNVLAATGNTGGVVADNQTQLLNERNVFTGMRDPLVTRQSDAARAAGLVLTIGAEYDACTGAAPAGGADKVFIPPYGYGLRTAAEVKAAVNTGAGNLSGVAYSDTTVPTASIAGPAAAVNAGAALSLRASVSGGTATAHQWRRGGVPLAGATSSTYAATMASAEAGTYTVEATLSSGELVVSAPVVVTLGTGTTGGGSTGGGSTGGSTGGGSGGGGAFGGGFLVALGLAVLLRRTAR